MSTPNEPPEEQVRPPFSPPPPPAWTPFDPAQLPPPGLAYGVEQPPRRRSRSVLVTAAVLAVLLAVGGGVGIGWTLARVILTPQVASGSNPDTVPPAVTSGGSGSNSALARAEAAIVDINTTVQTSQGTTPAAGTGMILTSTGEILTNNHVVDGATSIRVVIQGHSGDYSGRVIGVDPSADVALIKVSGVSGLPTVHFASASTVKVGLSVIAIGNALGQGGTPSVTEGSITALNQQITAATDNGGSEQLNGMIESNAPISPGDSGGALVDGKGEVLGMITAGQSRGFRSETSLIGYAIPATTAQNVVKQVRSGHATGEVLIGQPGYIGVSVQDLDAATAAQLGLSVSTGVLVTGVQSGSPAEQAGVAANSVITTINGQATPSVSALGGQIHQHHPGDQLSVTWTDQQGSSHTATMTLIGGPAV